MDARNLDLVRGTGVATYAGGVLAALPRLGARAELVRGAPSLPRGVRWGLAAWPGGLGTRVRQGVRTAPDLFRVAQVHFDLYGRPLVLGGRGLPDLMHWTYPLPVRLAGRANVYTVHDLIPLLHPGLTGIEGGRFRRLLGVVLRGAAHVVTVSEATRGELISVLGVEPGRVTNTWQSVDVSGAVEAGPGFAGCWVHVGAVERRKNLPRVIAAWRASGTRRDLVLAGPDGWEAGESLAAAADFLAVEGGPRVVRVPWLERGALLGLIRGARGLLMPSLAEGFGLPVAEAMALGTPVITSDRGALAEVGGDAVMGVDPCDVGALAGAMRALDGDDVLAGRLSAAGVRRAGLFGPAAYAGRLGRVYAGLGVGGGA